MNCMRVAAVALISVCVGTVAGAQTKPKSYAQPSAPDYDIRVMDGLQIQMKDGVHLYGHVFVPVGKNKKERFPVLFNYTPYRQTAESRYASSAYFVRRGYVDAHFQVRGSGNSEGTLPEREYSDQEMQDAVEVIAWLARQPWSNGKVGMYGYSWSGFNAAQVAMRKPPALKAIMVGAGTEDYYHEDIHYLDGILHLSMYNASIDLQTAQSPAPDFPLTEKYFKERFDQPPWSLIFLKHQRDDDAFWRRNQRLYVNPKSIAIPTFMTGGWLDQYRSSIPRMLERISAPTKAVVGPWNHSSREPGPAPEYRYEQVRWWDYWLKGRNTGILDEPRVTVYMRSSFEPQPWIGTKDIPGEWRSDDWPPKGLTQRAFYLGPNHTLGATASESSAVHTLEYFASVGPQAGYLWSRLQPDQRPVDAYSLVYDSQPLTDELAILGRPVAHLNASATARQANWFVRLSDVAPDGKVTLITGAGLNGTNRNSETDPEYLELGRVYPLVVNLHATSWIFQPGHRIRVAISNALWPMNWPSPYPMTTSLYLGRTALAGSSGSAAEETQVILPVVPRKSGAPLPAFVTLPHEEGPKMPGAVPPPSWAAGSAPRLGMKLVRDETTATTTATFGLEPVGAATGGVPAAVWTVSDLHPDQASFRGENVVREQVGDRKIVYSGFTDIRSDSTRFFYQHCRKVSENEKVVRERCWQDTIPRFYR
ncbi:MAG: CocE/NonD family hydrolase [Gemmatimonadales bacterium]